MEILAPTITWKNYDMIVGIFICHDLFSLHLYDYDVSDWFFSTTYDKYKVKFLSNPTG